MITQMVWHWADERPKESCRVLALVNSGNILDLSYSSRHDIFNTRDEVPAEQANENSLNDYVIMWANPSETIKDLRAYVDSHRA